MPVLVIAGQARSVEAHHKTSVAKADLGNETLETVTIHAADTGSAQVLVKLPGRARADLPKSAGLIRNATWKRRWAIAHHLLVEKAQTRARMLYQWISVPALMRDRLAAFGREVIGVSARSVDAIRTARCRPSGSATTT